MANPFAGAAIHWITAFFRLAPGLRPAGRLRRSKADSVRFVFPRQNTRRERNWTAPATRKGPRHGRRGSKHPKKRFPGFRVRRGIYAASARLHGRRTTAARQELEQMQEQLPGTPGSGLRPPTAGFCAALSCCALAPAQAYPGLGVRRGERPPDFRLLPPHPPDLCLDPLHPSPPLTGPLLVCTRGSA